jgi:hypothetical protein
MNKTKLLIAVSKGEHNKSALKYAAERARVLKCPIEMLYVIDTSDYQNLMGIEHNLKGELLREARHLLRDYASFIYDITKQITCVNVIEAESVGEGILKVVNSDLDINMVLLGVSKEIASKDKLVSWLAKHLGDRLMIPIMIIPNNLTDLQIHDLTGVSARL